MSSIPPTISSLFVTPEPSKAETNLRRLLYACDKRLADSNGILQEDERVKFLSSIKYLRKLKDDVDTEAGSSSNRAALDEYSRKIKFFANLIDEEKPPAPIDKGLSQVRLAKKMHQNQLGKNQENKIELMRRTVEETIQEELTASAQQANSSKAGEPEKAVLKNKSELFPDQSSLRHRTKTSHSQDSEPSDLGAALSAHRQVQEELTNDLARMAAQLKSSTLAFGDVLHRDKAIISEAQENLSGNLGRMKKENARLGKYSAKSTGTTCLTIGIVVFVIIMFMVAFVAIRILPKA